MRLISWRHVFFMRLVWSAFEWNEFLYWRIRLTAVGSEKSGDGMCLETLFCAEVKQRMQNVHRTIANSMWIAETHWICERSICDLVYLPHGDITIQLAKCGRLLNCCAVYMTQPVGWNFCRKSWFVGHVVSFTAGHCRCWEGHCQMNALFTAGYLKI